MEKIIEFNKKYSTILGLYGINTDLRKQHFFTQLYHESKLNPVSENLNYSSAGLMKTFARYFNSTTVNAYSRNPQKIANRVYASRMGNGNEASGDGWNYRGRGFIQLTGRNNYASLSLDTKIDFLNNPDLLLDEANSMIGACWFWRKNNLNQYADKDNIVGVRKAINGGTIGLDECKALLVKVKQII